MGDAGTPGEQWRPVVGWEGVYEVSNRGQVRSVPRTVLRSDGVWRPFPGRLLKLRVHQTGYLKVDLNRPGERWNAGVHVLVVTAFRGERPSGMQCCHWDGDPTNNYLSNLRWDTPSANRADKVRHGRDHNLNKTHCARAGHPLSGDNVIWVRGTPARQCRACHREASRASYRRTQSSTCGRGHPLEGENVLVYLRNGVTPVRMCRTCALDREAQKRPTHCPRGHALTSDNVYVYGRTGTRSCRTCKNERKVEARRAAKLASAQ